MSSLIDSALAPLPSYLRERLLDHSREGIRGWVSTTVIEQQRIISDLLSLHNATLGIHKLPEEILLRILRSMEISFCSPGGARQKSAIKLSSVCRHWRTIIVNSPLWWTHIDPSRDVGLSQLCLMRSADVNVCIWGPCGPPATDYRRTYFKVDLVRVVPLLLPHCSRFEAMTLALEHGSSEEARAAFSQLLGTPMPALAMLGLETETETKVPLAFSPTHFPRLRYLRLSCVVIQGAPWPLACLTCLVVHDVESRCSDGSQGSLSLHDLLDILEACPALKTVAYRATWLSPVGANHAVVSLPHLRHLQLSAELVDISQVIAHLAPLGDVHLSLKPNTLGIDHAPNISPPLLRAVFPQGVSGLPALGRVHHIFISGSSKDSLIMYASADRSLVSMKYYDGGVLYCFPITALEQRINATSLLMSFSLKADRTWDTLFPGIMGELAAGIFPPAVASLNICGEICHIPTHRWEQVLTVMPGLLRLEIIGVTGSMLALFHALAPATFAVPCPQLKELILSCDENTALVLSSLEVALRRRLEQGCRLVSLLLVVSKWRATIKYPGKPRRLPTLYRAAQKKLQRLVDSFFIESSE